MKEIMNKENHSMDDMFRRLEGQWDIYEPKRGHANRFLDKQSHRKNIGFNGFTIGIAATLLLAFGLIRFSGQTSTPNTTASVELSRQTRETDSVFTAIIKYEMARVNQKDSPANRQIVRDALVQLEEMDKDYERIRTELAKGGETEQLIQALVRNLKTQISFLENVLQQIETNEQIKNTSNENIL